MENSLAIPLTKIKAVIAKDFVNTYALTDSGIIRYDHDISMDNDVTSVFHVAELAPLSPTFRALKTVCTGDPCREAQLSPCGTENQARFYPEA